MDKKVKPIFIFGLPRSGSTLLQKIISHSKQVSTVSEPWILLPLTYLQKKDGLLTIYSHSKAIDAINDLNMSLNEKGNSIDELIREFTLSLYQKLSGDSSIYFLDKTPRYFLIIPEIVKLFPEAKFIFLFRNPLSQFSSKLNTRRDNKFKNLYSSYIDLNEGPNLLASGFKSYSSISLKLTYEDIIFRTDQTIQKIEDYLSISIKDDSSLDLGMVELKGSMGDPLLNFGGNDKIDESSINKWKETFSTVLRKKIAANYLYQIGDDYFDCLGKSRKQLIEELNDINTSIVHEIKSSPLDLYHLLYNKILSKFKPYLIFPRIFKKHQWIKNNFLN
ncbi:sulfotransferase family protein [Namhaeicola litoreus]|uniref:Sulfotransferase family protein n=1 Tax=Namhaeicola litoreus TaxID=1052145 RepID=A0ABW3Y8F0_9FLAO